MDPFTMMLMAAIKGAGNMAQSAMAPKEWEPTAPQAPATAPEEEGGAFRNIFEEMMRKLFGAKPYPSEMIQPNTDPYGMGRLY